MHRIHLLPKIDTQYMSVKYTFTVYSYGFVLCLSFDLAIDSAYSQHNFVKLAHS